MKNSTINIRLDEDLKKQFTELCDQFGMTTTSAITVFVRAVVRSRRIPFDIIDESATETSDESAQTEQTATAKSSKKENTQIQELTSKLIDVVTRGGNAIGIGGKAPRQPKPRR